MAAKRLRTSFCFETVARSDEIGAFNPILGHDRAIKTAVVVDRHASLFRRCQQADLHRKSPLPAMKPFRAVEGSLIQLAAIEPVSRIIDSSASMPSQETLFRVVTIRVVATRIRLRSPVRDAKLAFVPSDGPSIEPEDSRRRPRAQS